jgi:hypothetical protein
MQIFYYDITAINKYNMSRIFNLVIRYIFKINKRLAIYGIVFHCILIRRINSKTIIYKCITCDGVIVAGRIEGDPIVPVIADIIACNGIIAGRPERDASRIVADIVACNDVVAGRGVVDSLGVVANIVICNSVVAGRVEVKAIGPVVANIIACDGVVVAGMPEVDAVIVVADSIARNGIVAGRLEDDAVPVVAYFVV